MSTSTQVSEIRLYNAMLKNKLSLTEAIEAMNKYANDKDFDETLDSVYNKDVLLTDEWDIWSDR